MELQNVPHCIDNLLTQAQARLSLSNTQLLVTWFTNHHNEQSVVHSHPYHELVLPIGGSAVRYFSEGSVYMVQVGELIYFPAQNYHSGKFTITAETSDRLVIQIEDPLWQAARRSASLLNSNWMRGGDCAGPSGLRPVGLSRAVPSYGPGWPVGGYGAEPHL